jgi:predicted RNA-binding protein YlxR (DUF448 family)
MPRPNHKLRRTCLGCMQRDAKLEMTRLAVVGNAIAVDKEACLSGRGGYLHRRADCVEKFVRSKVKEFRSLRRRMSLDERLKIAELIRTPLDSNAALE